MLNKVRNIFIGAAIFLAAGAATYFSTEVDWEAAFGPGIAGVVLASLGWFTREGLPKLTAYLEAQKTTEV